MKTYPIITFGRDSLIARTYAKPTINIVMEPFADLQDLMDGKRCLKPIATLEPDFWLLDGNYKFAPPSYESFHMGIFGSLLSDASGEFAVDPVLSITFRSLNSTLIEVSTTDLVLYFGPPDAEYCNSFTVSYYRGATHLRTDSYAPTSSIFHTHQAVSNYSVIVLTFHSTSNPYRHFRLSDIDFDVENVLQDEIKECSVLEEISMMSESMTSNSLEFSLVAPNANLNIIEPTGIYANLKKGTMVNVHEVVGNDVEFMGRFFIDTWENKSDTEVKFYCSDLVSKLDQIQFPFPADYHLKPTLNNSWAQIFLSFFSYYPYFDTTYPISIDPALIASNLVIGDSTYIVGWPYGTAREALLRAAFARSSYVSCDRSSSIKVRKSKLISEVVAFDRNIGLADEKIISVGLRAPVTGIRMNAFRSITSSSWTLTEKQEVFLSDRIVNDIDRSSATIQLKDIIYTPGAEIEAANTAAVYHSPSFNFLSAIIFVDTPGKIRIIAPVLHPSPVIFEKLNPSPDPETPENILIFEDNFCVDPYFATILKDRLYDYYQQRYIQKVALYPPMFVAIGDSVRAETYGGRFITGIVERIKSDLTGGCRQEVEIVGVVEPL